MLSTEPIGRIPEEIDPADWVGVWVHEKSFGLDAVVAVVSLASRDEARFDISWLDLDGDEVQLRKWTGVLRELNDELFLSVKGSRDDESDMTRYCWARIERDGDLVRAWVPEYDEFEKLVTNRALSGRIDKGEFEITLDELDAEEARLISSRRLPTMPVILRRIGK